VTETRSRVLAAGVDPALVVRMELAPGVDLNKLIERLAVAGLEVVSVDSNRQVIVAFRADDDLSSFEEAMNDFSVGPRPGAKTSQWDVLEYIEPDSVRRWARADRIGPRLRADQDVVRFDPNDLYKLDVELWHPGTTDGATAALDKVQQFVGGARDRGARVLDTYVGRTICLVRVALRGEDVDALLEISEVAEVDLPPVVDLHPSGEPSSFTAPLPRPAPPPEGGPRVCVLDSGLASGHPLLGPYVGDASSVHSSITSAADLHGHGTAVAGAAVFGDLRRRLETRDFDSTITVFSARMLDDNNELDDEKLVVNQIREAVERYREPPFSCRVFNIAFGERETFIAKSRGRQGIWAEVLDILAVEYDVVFVVAAGNVPVITSNAEEAERLVVSAGRHLREPQHRLVDPATSALAVTVGAISARAQTTTPRGAGADDIRRPVAPNSGDPAPFTRVGPGVFDALKPDFVDDGGNLTWSGFGSFRTVHQDEANSVLLLNNQMSGLRGWFRYDVGTSYAAPRVARVAALVEHRLRVDLGRPPTSNLVRAVLGAGAVSANDVDEHCGSGATVNMTGYGRVDEDFALWSSERRVVLLSEEELPLDHFAMFELPVPDEFMALRGRKHLTAAVAYDPPTRARRAEYLGVSLDFNMYRGIDQDELFEHYRTRRRDEGVVPKVDRYKLGMTPGAGLNREFRWNRSRSTLQVGRYSFQRTQKDNKWWLVVRVRRRWAPQEYENQRFALAVVLEADEGDFYARVQAQLRARSRTRIRR